MYIPEYLICWQLNPTCNNQEYCLTLIWLCHVFVRVCYLIEISVVKISEKSIFFQFNVLKIFNAINSRAELGLATSITTAVLSLSLVKKCIYQSQIRFRRALQLHLSARYCARSTCSSIAYTSRAIRRFYKYRGPKIKITRGGLGACSL